MSTNCCQVCGGWDGKHDSLAHSVFDRGRREATAEIVKWLHTRLIRIAAELVRLERPYGWPQDAISRESVIEVALRIKLLAKAIERGEHITKVDEVK